jgi:RNA recognition motif-containing protein
MLGLLTTLVSPSATVCRLPLQNLPTDADKLFLYEKFSPYGAILSVKVLNDPQSGQCRGVGFVVSGCKGSANRSWNMPLHGIVQVQLSQCCVRHVLNCSNQPQLCGSKLRVCIACLGLLLADIQR